MHARAKSSWIKHLDFIFADLICLNVTFLFAYCLRNRGIYNIYADRDYRMLVIVAMILHFCISFFSNHYSKILKRGYFLEFKKVFFHNIELTGFLLAFMFVVQLSNSFSRIIIAAFFVMDTIAMYFVHIIMKYIYGKSTVRESKQTNVLLFSTLELAPESIEKIMQGADRTYVITGVALEQEALGIKEICGIPVVAYGKDVYEYACRNVVDEVVVCLESSEMEKMERIAGNFLEMGITVHLKMDIIMREAAHVHFGHVNSMEVLTASVNNVPITDLFLKRVIDICAGIVGCFITAILYIFIAPAIKIADPKGPVFFAQERVGRNGRTFKIYKFRSMYSDAEERKKELMKDNKMDGLMFKIDADPRIIGSGSDGKKKGLGHFLRSTSLDEFPNFWSILKGDMSLVGTRPPTMDEYEKYELHHKSRLAAKPGLTGMWQVSGRSDMTDFEEIVKLDNEYIKNWSIGLDIKIVLKTVVVVLARKGSV